MFISIHRAATPQGMQAACLGVDDLEDSTRITLENRCVLDKHAACKNISGINIDCKTIKKTP